MSGAAAVSSPLPVEAVLAFPHLSVDFGDGVAHVVPLPASASRHELQRLAFEQVLVWRRPFALVFGEDDALLFDANGGSVRAGRAPQPKWVLEGRLAAFSPRGTP